MDATDQTLALLILLGALVITIITTQVVRGGAVNPALRYIKAYRETLPRMVGLSIESSRPLHLSLGSAGIGGEQTLLAIASAELVYQMTERVAIGDAVPILTMTNTSAIPLAQDTLRRAYRSRGLLSRFKATNIRWYPAGNRSMAFAAAVTTMMAHDKVAGNMMAGSYGIELALIMDQSARHNVPIVAVSDQLEGQAIAYALSDAPLIGEEIFAAGTYLDGGSVQVGETMTVDVLRWLLIIALLVAFVAGIINNGG